MPEQEYNKVEELVIQLKAYVNTEIELLKLNAADRISKVIADFTAVVFVAAFFLIFIFFFSLALAWLIGGWLEKPWAGFLIVALGYLLIGVIAWIAREKLFRIPIMNAIIRRLFSRDHEKRKEV